MKKKQTIVIALGGNAILRPGQKGTASEQIENIRNTCIQISKIIKEEYKIIITHGNGPQIGNILIQNGMANERVPQMSLDICGAQTQGFIGYMLQQQLKNIILKENINTQVISVITQVVVDENDKAFKNPSKPVGPFYSYDYAKKMQDEKAEAWIEDAGRGWRRVVPSPEPKKIVEIDIIKKLIDLDSIIITNGGGGIPVIEKDYEYIGIEGVIDKDLSGEVLATSINAEVLLILTDVKNVCINFRCPNQIELREISISELEKYQMENHFKAGSMGPKVEACIRFIKNGGQRAIITSLDTACDALKGLCGTIIHK